MGNTCFINAVLQVAVARARDAVVRVSSRTLLHPLWQALASLPDFLTWVRRRSDECKFGRLCRSLAAVLDGALRDASTDAHGRCGAHPSVSCAALNAVEQEEGSVGTAELLSALMSHGWVIDFRQQVGGTLVRWCRSQLAGAPTVLLSAGCSRAVPGVADKPGRRAGRCVPFLWPSALVPNTASLVTFLWSTSSANWGKVSVAAWTRTSTPPDCCPELQASIH